MFNSNFFPTPIPVIERMLEGYTIKHSTRILEPSAGKGDIAEYIVNKYRVSKKDFPYDWQQREYEKELKLQRSKISCIEPEPELRSILLDKGYKVVDTDFLSHPAEKEYDLVIMNPPFDQGDKHLIQALTLYPYAEIRCILNIETLTNPYSRYRKALKGLLKKRKFKLTKLGNCFSTAERKSNVQVVLVQVEGQPDKTKFSFGFDPSKMTGKEKLYTMGDLKNNQIESTDVINSLVHRYNKIKELGAKINELQAEMNFYANGLVGTSGYDAIHKVSTYSYNDFVDLMRKASWDNLFTETKIANMVTSSVRKEIEEGQNTHANSMAFTETNIVELLIQLTQSLKEIRKKCVGDAFDSLTYYYDENRVIPEGWKSNKAWIVSRKCVLPNAIDNMFTKSWNSNFQNKILDIQKALCLITGIEYDKIRKQCIGYDYYQIKDLEYGKWHDSFFFEYRFYKKQTCHIKFKDENLWKAFNREACLGRNWIGGGFNENGEEIPVDIFEEEFKALMVV